MRMTKPSKHNLEQLPHITMTSNVEWDPSQYDEEWDAVFDEEPPPLDHDMDNDIDYGEEFSNHDLNIYSCIQDSNLVVSKHKQTKTTDF